MDGDIAVALAGVDSRVRRVAALVATPDWTRPGMRDVTDPDVVIDQGQADTYARWFYDHLDPWTHLKRYQHGPAISFECGAADTHVPAEAAQRFRKALQTHYPLAGNRVRIALHPQAHHFSGVRDPAFARNALDWLTDETVSAA